MIMNLTIESDESLVAKARNGDMDALDALVRQHQSWVFNLALRMVWRREVAEDATQEILIKAVTKLSTFAGHSAFRTWLYRIAVNHLLNVRKSEMEEKKMTFTDMGASLDSVKDEDLPDERTLPVETKILVEEAKLGCITAMLYVPRPKATAGVHPRRSFWRNQRSGCGSNGRERSKFPPTAFPRPA